MSEHCRWSQPGPAGEIERHWLASCGGAAGRRARPCGHCPAADDACGSGAPQLGSESLQSTRSEAGEPELRADLVRLPEPRFPHSHRDVPAEGRRPECRSCGDKPRRRPPLSPRIHSPNFPKQQGASRILLERSLAAMAASAAPDCRIRVQSTDRKRPGSGPGDVRIRSRFAPTPRYYARLKIESWSVPVLSAKPSSSTPRDRRMLRYMLDIRVSPSRQ